MENSDRRFGAPKGGTINKTGDGLAADRAAVDASLDLLSGESRVEGPVEEAIRYAITGGGKRFRALLVMASYRSAGGRGNAARLAAAVEVIHAYSLVHDD